MALDLFTDEIFGSEFAYIKYMKFVNHYVFLFLAGWAQIYVSANAYAGADRIDLSSFSCEKIYSDHRSDMVADIVYRDGVKPKASATRYVTKRGLLEYMIQFESLNKIYPSISLVSNLSRLGPQNVVVDFGSGEGFAIEDMRMLNAENLYQKKIKSMDFQSLAGAKGFKVSDKLMPYLYQNYSSEKNRVLFQHEHGAKPVSTIQNEDMIASSYWNRFFSFVNIPPSMRPKVVGITYEMKRAEPQVDGLKIFKGRLFEEISKSEIPMFDVGTLYFGVDAYTKKWSEAWIKILSRCKVGGKIFDHGSVAKVLVDDIDPQTGAKIGTKKVLWSQYLLHNSRGLKIIFDEQSPYTVVIEKMDTDVYLPELIYESQIGKEESPPEYLFIPSGRFFKIN